MTDTDYDWAVLDLDGVSEVIETVAARVAARLDLDADDLVQEASILVADTTRNLHPAAMQINGLTHGTLSYRLAQDLADVTKTERDRRSKNTSYEARSEALELANLPLPSQPNVVLDYPRDLVERLLPAVWDEDYCYGIQVEHSPDPDMPRGSTNKATGNTYLALLADIRSAWREAFLSLEERRVLLLTYGMDWEQKAVAFNLGLSRQTVGKRAYSGVGKLMQHLNGTDWDEFADADVVMHDTAEYLGCAA